MNDENNLQVYHIPWKHIFLIQSESSYEIYKKDIKMIYEWCIKNCTQQFLINDRPGTASIYALPNANNPIHDKSYNPSVIKNTDILTVAFENEDEALAFKLNFGC